MVKLTKEGLEKVKKELDYLENVKRREVSERIRHAASYGDLKENASYTEAKDEQGFVEARIRELKATLGQAEVIERGKGDDAQVGCSVTVKSKDGQETFQIVGEAEADVLCGKISLKSLLGSALLGKKKGETVKVKTPGGEMIYKIVDIK